MMHFVNESLKLSGSGIADGYSFGENAFTASPKKQSAGVIFTCAFSGREKLSGKRTGFNDSLVAVH